MGLDGVELIMAFEEGFGISLPDEETVKMYTPKMVADYIFDKLQKTDEKTCQSQRAFYLLRKAFMKIFGCPRDSIKPDMLIKELISEKNATFVWNNIKEAVQARSWPKLVRPPWLSMVLLILPPILFFLFWRVLWPVLFELTWMAVTPLAIVFTYAEIKLTKKYMTRIPRRVKTIRDLVPYAVTSEQIKWTRDQVSELVKKIVLEQLNLSEADYREDAHFVDDFGLDR
jgi:acyl carrier protein